MLLYALLLAFLGLVMIFLEFFMPGGVLAVLGALAIIAGTVLLGAFGPGWGLATSYFILCLILTGATCFLALKKIKKSGKKDSFYLSRDQEGFVAASLDPALLGKKGMAASDLKPSGHVQIEGRPYQAVSERGYINKGCEIEVIGSRSAYLIVKPIKD